MKYENIKIPDKLDEVVKESMDKVYEESRSKKKKAWIAKGCGMVAAASCIVVIGFSNPTFAAKLPVIGHIFETMQDNFWFGGDYNGIAEVLTEETEVSISDESNITENEANSPYKKTDNGVTVTLSEIYSNTQAAYISLAVHSDEVIPDIYDLSVYWEAKSSLNDTVFGDCSALQGERIDDNTYAGIIRVDLNDGRQSVPDLEELENGYSLDLKIYGIGGGLVNPPTPEFDKTEEEMQQMTDAELEEYMNNWVEAHPDYNDSQEFICNDLWEYSLDVNINKDDMQIVDLSSTACDGIGFSSVIKDRFEITIYGLNDNPLDVGNYFPVIFDANGHIMDHGTGNVNTYAINDSDVSKIELVLVDDDIWFNELKKLWYVTEDGLSDPEEISAFKKLVLEKCAYHTEVVFE